MVRNGSLSNFDLAPKIIPAANYFFLFFGMGCLLNLNSMGEIITSVQLEYDKMLGEVHQD